MEALSRELAATEVSAGDPVVRLLGMAFMAPVAGYVLVTPTHPSSKGTGQVFRAICTVLVSAAILAVTTGSDWNVGSANVVTQYSAYSGRRMEGVISARIGLGSATLQLHGSVPELPLAQVDYHERFSWSHAEDMKRHYNDALERGLPYPMLTAAEYLSLDTDGFRWGRHYRQAGYYAYFCLWSAFALWLLSNILWPVDLVYSAACLMLTGMLLLLTNIIYSFNLPSRPLIIPYEGGSLEFAYGWCYYTTFAVGILCFLFGSSIYLLHLMRSPDELHELIPEKFPLAGNGMFEQSWRRHIGNYQKMYDKNSADMFWTK